jgi:LacI family transcriptional regulator
MAVPRGINDRTLPRVLLLVETSTSWGRRLIEGVINYSRAHGPWTLYLEPRGIGESESLPARWTGNGIIARIPTPAMMRRLKQTKLPVVNVSGIMHPRIDVPRVMTEDAQIAQAALDHLKANGFRHYAYCGVEGNDYVTRRARTFQRVVKAQGFDCAVYLRRTGRPVGADPMADERERAKWLVSLPKPVAVMTSSAVHGRRVAEAAASAGLRVPDDVAIITVDTDDLIGELIHPPLSAVQLATERLGFEAARSLDLLIRGKPAPALVTLPPSGIAERQSTNVLAIDDVVVCEALRYIRRNANQPINVRDVLAQTAVSRRILERRFREALHRTPAQEIRRLHIERVKLLLAQTNLSLIEIARSSGFNYVEHMIPQFRKTVGMTPMAYRRQVQSM